MKNTTVQILVAATNLRALEQFMPTANKIFGSDDVALIRKLGARVNNLDENPAYVELVAEGFGNSYIALQVEQDAYDLSSGREPRPLPVDIIESLRNAVYVNANRIIQ